MSNSAISIIKSLFIVKCKLIKLANQITEHHCLNKLIVKIPIGIKIQVDLKFF